MKTVIGVGLLLAAILPGSVAQAAEPSGETVRSRIVESSNKKISCYALKHRDAVHCKGSVSSNSEKVLELGKRGKAKRVRVGDYPGYASEPKRIHHGDTWQRNGVRCTIGRSAITCFNLDGHGFHLGKKGTETF